MATLTVQDPLAEAERLIRTRGYGAFNLCDLAASTSITEVELIRLFTTKENLCLQLIRRHIEHVTAELRDIGLEYRDAESRLIAFACLFYEGFERDTPPFSCVLAAARSGVSSMVRSQIDRLFRLRIRWVQAVLEKHWASGDQRPTLSPERAAHLLFCTLEGEALVECALGADKPSATGFTQALVMLGIGTR
jgi:AcrR family transcriptional regulator